MTPRTHGTDPRGLSNTPVRVSYEGRFGRLFHGLPSAFDPESPGDDRLLREIAEAMHATEQTPSSDNSHIPAGYTYLGQFIDHDLTFDPATTLQRRNDPEGLLDFRSPRFDLDSVYGRGPQDEPFLYDPRIHDGAGMLLEPTGEGFDMPRNARARALIGDPRNDENGIVSQLHVTFLLAHNAALERVIGEGVTSGQEAFDAAQRLVQWHFQWVVVHDFLPRVIGGELWRRLVTRRPAPGGDEEVVHLRFYRYKRNPFLPVEFSVAAYRFGHSMVRDEYSINGSFHRRLFDSNDPSNDFRGFQPLRAGWHASWPFFFELDDIAPQSSRTIDTKLSSVLSTLEGATGEDADLALRNLRRGAALGLPSGQAVATKMGVEPLVDTDLEPCPPGRAPLWFYVLREAETKAGGEHLGPVGGRLVGETLLGLLRADPQSYLRLKPDWRPSLPVEGDGPASFGMGDLIRFAAPVQANRF
jgi:Animal haem peroxidase